MTVLSKKALLLLDVENTKNGGYISQVYQSHLQGEEGMTDNGGAPDGNAWLIWVFDEYEQGVISAQEAGAELINVYHVDYDWNQYNILRNIEHEDFSYLPKSSQDIISRHLKLDFDSFKWSGLQSTDEAITTSLEFAEILQYLADNPDMFDDF